MRHLGTLRLKRRGALRVWGLLIRLSPLGLGIHRPMIRGLLRSVGILRLTRGLELGRLAALGRLRPRGTLRQQRLLLLGLEQTSQEIHFSCRPLLLVTSRTVSSFRHVHALQPGGVPHPGPTQVFQRGR